MRLVFKAQQLKLRAINPLNLSFAVGDLFESHKKKVRFIHFYYLCVVMKIIKIPYISLMKINK